jgi:hypothetical protein
VAVAFHDGAVTPASFTPERVRDPALRPLIAKIAIDEDKNFTQRFPQEGNCRMEVTTVSGQCLVAHTAYPKGHQRNPLSDADVGLDHGVGHFQRPSLCHGALRRTERCWRYGDRFQNRCKHRPRFLPAESLRRRRPVRTCEEKVMNRRQTCPLSGMVQSAQLMVPQ